MCGKVFPCLASEDLLGHFDAWFYLLYLHPIFTREEFLDEKVDIWILYNVCPFTIILIITSVCCVYSYFIYTLCFYHLFPTSCFDIWVVLLQDIGANEREWYQCVEKEMDYMKGLNVCPTSHLPCVTRYSGVAVHVPYIEVGMFWGAWYFFPEDSTLHVPSIVLVCGCNLPLCLREVIFLLSHWELRCEDSSSGRRLPLQ